MVELIVFLIAGTIVLGGAFGVILNSNPVHAALSLVATLFGVAVLFIAQDAHFLAAIQVIVYAGAIVVLFLFVIMLLGVDQAEQLEVEPLTAQRPVAILAGVVLAGFTLVALLAGGSTITGQKSVRGDIARGEDAVITNVDQIGRVLFTDYVLAFEITAVLLTIAVVGSVVLARKLHSNERSLVGDDGETTTPFADEPGEAVR